MAGSLTVRLALVVLLFAWASPLGASSGATRLVVLLHSYDASMGWTRDITEGVYGGLHDAGVDVDLRQEFLDTRRDSRPEYLARVRDVLAIKYARQPPALVLTSDDQALEFLLSYPELFAGTPVVFGGVESRDVIAMAPRDRFTGVAEEFHIDFIIKTALELRPAARRVFVVTADTRGGAAIRAEIGRLRSSRPGVTLRDVSGADLTRDQIVAILRTEVTADDVVIATPIVRDVSGVPLDGRETVAYMAEASRAPIFGVGLSETDQGALAATASTGVTHGQWMARKARAILAEGRRPADIPVEVDAETRLAFEASQLAQWGIAEARLPAGSVVRNRTVSFYREHRALILGALGFIAVQSLIIGGLVLNVHRRRLAEQGLSRQALELASANRHLEDANQSLRYEHEARRRTEEHLRQAQKMEAVGRLAGGVAHDFNNLLTVIIGYCSLLLNDRSGALDRREALLQMRRAGEQAATLTQNLLAFSRRQVASPIVIDMVAGIRALESMLRRFCGGNITLVLQLDERTGLVELGQGQLEQVVINLVINARDAMPEGGTLVVGNRADLIVDTQPDVPELKPGIYAVLTVTDSGVGMDAETRARVFEPFFTTKAAGRGTGLGLATVYGIVTQNGGAIAVRSEPGSGSEFSVWFPVTSRAVANPAAPPRATEPLRRYTVLLVEDEDDLRRLTALVLRKAGLTVLEANGGPDAVRVAGAHAGSIDLLLTDVVMPGTDGFDLAKRLSETRPTLAVAYMSGYVDEALQASVPDVEEGHLLRKPFTPEELLAHVTRALTQATGATKAAAG